MNFHKTTSIGRALAVRRKLLTDSGLTHEQCAAVTNPFGLAVDQSAQEQTGYSRTPSDRS